MRAFHKITIIGVGLSGGSIGLAAKKARVAKEVVGIFRRRSTLRKALKAKAVDWGTLDFQKGTLDADLVIIATPVGSIAAMAKKAMPFMKRGAILTDVGSVKTPIVREVEKILSEGVTFVGGHPMAGSEKTSVVYARDALFRGSLCILTETRRTEGRALRKVAKFWKAL